MKCTVKNAPASCSPLLPRMLLTRPLRGGKNSPAKLEREDCTFGLKGDGSTSLKRVQRRAQLPGQQLLGSAGASQIRTGKLHVMLGEPSSARGDLALGN